MSKNLTEEDLESAFEYFADYKPEPDRNIWLSGDDLDAKEIIGMHIAEFIDLDWKALTAQGWQCFIQPNGMVKLRR